MPNLYDYLDYRAFLADWIAAKKKANPRYSHRLFARKADQPNPSLLSLIIQGKRNLTTKLLPGFGKALELDAEQRRFLAALIELDRTTDPEQQTELVEKIVARQRFHGAARVDEGFRYISHWYFPAIRELAARPDFRFDPAWVAVRLQPRISVAKARDALETLAAIGMLEPNEEGGAVQTDASVVTAHEVRSLAVRNYHRGMASLAHQCLAHPGGPQRHFGAVTLLVPAAKVARLKEEIAAFQERVLHLCDASDEPGDVVMQLNLQLFPLSVPEEEVS